MSHPMWFSKRKFTIAVTVNRRKRIKTNFDNNKYRMQFGAIAKTHDDGPIYTYNLSKLGPACGLIQIQSIVLPPPDAFYWTEIGFIFDTRQHDRCGSAGVSRVFSFSFVRSVWTAWRTKKTFNFNHVWHIERFSEPLNETISKCGASDTREMGWMPHKLWWIVDSINDVAPLTTDSR